MGSSTRTYNGAVYCRKIAFAAVVSLVARTKSRSSAAYRIAAQSCDAVQTKAFAPGEDCNRDRGEEGASEREFKSGKSCPFDEEAAGAPDNRRCQDQQQRRIGGFGEIAGQDLWGVSVRLWVYWTASSLSRSCSLRYLPNTPFQGGMTIETAPCAWAWQARRMSGFGSFVFM